MGYMKLTTKGKRTPRTQSIKVFRAERKSIMEISKLLGCSKQWIDFVLKRDGDPLDTPVDKSTIDTLVG